MIIYCLIGPSACGKTTHARTIAKYDANVVIVNRDLLREQLFGYSQTDIDTYYERPDLRDCEGIVTTAQDALIKRFLAEGKDIVLDNTHLRLNYINKIKEYNVPISFGLIETDFDTALQRDKTRGLRGERNVGEAVLRKQFAELEELKKVFDFKMWTPPVVEPIVQDPTKPWAYIFDVDGTLALNKSGRSPFDWKHVVRDVPNEPVIATWRVLIEGNYHLIVCSGRDAECWNETKKWLLSNGVKKWERLYMRPQGDHRKDSVVKEEFWREIAKDYYIVALFDDRNQVVEHARKLGLTVFQVAEGNF